MTQEEAGGRVVGRYLLCDAIASGGMATVHLGRLLGPVGFSRTVAIKRLHPHFARDPEFVAMFLDEARLAARIRHPNVVSTLDVVVLQGELFVIMDYVHGEALSRLVRTTGPVPIAIAISIISGVLYGLHAAHEAKTDDGGQLHIVHRDVSPQNVLVGVDGTARVVDFGVAKAVGRLQTTREGALKGKISYMSPEQISSDQVDRRTDIYAASVVFWEMLTGKRLFQADNEVRVIQKVLSGTIDPPSKYAPIPKELDALVLKGLAREPSLRFPTAWDMAEQVQRIAFATPGQVSEWVAKLGGTIIEQRARKVAEVESRSQNVGPISMQNEAPSPAAKDEAEDDGDRTEASDSAAFVRSPSVPGPLVAALAQEAEHELKTQAQAPLDVAMMAPPADAPAEPAPSPAIPIQHEFDSQVSALNVSSSTWRRPAWLGRARLMVGIGVGFLALVFIIGLLVSHSSNKDSTSAASSSPPSATATVVIEHDQHPSGSINPVTTPAPEVIAAPHTPTTATAIVATATTPATPTHTAATSTATTHVKNCNPPYTIKDGIRIPKMECL